MRALEKVKYRSVPVRDLFLEMKNLSELMIDLAYSAALFNDRELAEEVMELENRVDTLDYLLEMTIMIAARDAHDAEALAGVSAAASAADKISDAAADIAAIVTQNIGVHPIVSQVFEKVEERLMQAKVSAGSSIVGKRVGELDLAARMGVDIIAVRRDKDWIINPENTEQIRGGDVLIARGVQSGIREFKELAEQKPRRRED
ncbi:MAG: TrkA C-terminal domain-containing protein [Candidatus Bathyarchaeia archaeon]|jgi:uncharacterized protein with PhoU and TrkA domain